MRRALWPAVLLVPQPVLSVLFLLAVRAERLPPAFGPAIALGLFPVAAAALGAVALREGSAGARWVVLGLAVAELASVAVVAAMVGFAKAWRSG